MTGTLDDDYFEWLYGVVLSVRNRNPARSFWNMARQLYVKEFIWFIPNDDNRVEDGKSLRLEFMEERGINEVDLEWLNLGCSMLEMLIALSRHASFEDMDGKTHGEWFGIFMHNMGLSEYSDLNYDDEIAQTIDEKMDRVIYRHYHASGEGGIFPLRHAHHDQRKVELWYQMSAYLLENSPI